MNSKHIIARPYLGLPLFLIAMAALAPASAVETPEGFEESQDLFNKFCISCHTIGRGERVATDLLGITKRRPHDWLVGYIGNATQYLKTDALAMDLLFQYENLPMPDLHITEDEIQRILEFIEAHDAVQVPTIEKPTPLGWSLEGPDERQGASAAGIALLGFTLLASVALWVGGFPKAAQLGLVVALGLGYWSFGGRQSHVLIHNGNDQGYSPEQPIDFSHALHAGDLQISCFYCHSGADRSAVAGIPAVSTCMNCHKVIDRREGQSQASPEIAKIAAAWASLETDAPHSIPWVRVHDLADFVFFNHQVHVNNNIQCQECHGPVQTMERIRQAGSLTMGWCIRCHKVAPEDKPDHWKSAGATLDCMACHN